MFYKKFPEASIAGLCIFLTILSVCVAPFIMSRPLGLMALALAATQLFWAIRTKIKWLQNTLLFSMSCFIGLFAANFFLNIYSPNISMSAVRLYDGQPKNPAIRDDLLGFGYEPKAKKMRTQKILGDKVLFDVTVTLNDRGYRITPTHPNAKIGIVLLGCSFTEGVGVEDHETYAYRLSELLGENYQVYNFGFGGYGPHQALALLESDRLDFLKKSHEKLHFYFLSIGSHEWRSAGLVEWDSYGPRYILENGQAIRKGSFDLGFTLFTKLWEVIKKSDLLQRYVLRKIFWTHEEALALQTAILLKCNKVIVEKFHSDFTVLLEPAISNKQKEYTHKGLKIIDLKAVLPNWPHEGTTIPLDGHPTPFSHDKVAGAIAKSL